MEFFLSWRISLPALPSLVCDAAATLRFSAAAPSHQTNAAATTDQAHHIAIHKGTIALKHRPAAETIYENNRMECSGSEPEPLTLPNSQSLLLNLSLAFFVERTFPACRPGASGLRRGSTPAVATSSRMVFFFKLIYSINQSIFQPGNKTRTGKKESSP